MQIFICSLKEKKTCYRISETTWWVDHPLCSRVKQSLTKPSFRNWLICANHMLVLMRVICLPTQCVKLCQQDFTRIGILIRRPASLCNDRTRPAALKIWSNLIFNKQGQNVKLKASIQKADRKKLHASMLMDFAVIATLSLRLWGAFITFATVGNYVPLSLKKISNAVLKRENWIRWDKTI